MSNIVETEYQIVQERTLPVIISEIKIIEKRVIKETMEGAVQIGLRLQEAKEQVGHGNFGKWCEENLNYSQNTASKFMRLAEESKNENGMLSNRATWQNISISKAFRLLSVPEEDREKFMEEHDVEDMTVRQLEEEIRQLKEEKTTLEEEVWNVSKDRSEIDGKLMKAEEEVQKLQGQLASATAESEKIEMLNEKLKKAKEKLKREKASRQEEIDKAHIELKDELRKQAMEEAGAALTEARTERDGLQEENAALKRKLNNTGNESIVKFKILVDQLQDIFDQAGQCILVEQDPETSDKMNAALRQVVEKFREEL